MSRVRSFPLAAAVLTALATPFFAQESQPGTLDLREVENPRLPGLFREFTTPRPDGSSATLYMGAHHPDGWATRPLLVWCQGSGAQSLFMEVGNGAITSSLFGLLGDNAPDFRVAAVEKRGVAFGEMGNYGTATKASPEYQAHATLEERAADVRLLISALLEHPDVDPSMVLVVGHSEGADVAARVAGTDERVTHAAVLSGGGPPQFYDFFLMRRAAMQKEGRSVEEIEAAMAELEGDVRRIVADPDNQEELYLGHAYKRWATFATQGCADYLVNSRAKLFIAHGSEDTSVPIESFDYLVARLLCAGRTDVTIRRFPGRDHSYTLVGEGPGADGFLELFHEVLEWALLE